MKHGGGILTRRATPSACLLALTVSAGCRLPLQELPDGEVPAFTGSLSGRYRARAQGSSQDNDLFEVLRLDWQEEGEDPLRASLLARVSIDLDGEGDADDPFASLADADGGWARADLYSAYVDVPVGELSRRVRVGRQQDSSTPEVAWFDGVHLQDRPRGEQDWIISAYGGIPVRQYGPGSSGDRIGGITLEGRPWSGARARFDWMHLRDERLLDAHQDDLLGGSLHQVLGEHWSLRNEADWLEGSPREARTVINYLGDDGLSVRLFHRELLQEQAQLSLELDPFYDSLRTLHPYRTTRLEVAGDLGPLTVEVGGDLRRLADGDQEGNFNREYDRGRLAFTLPAMQPGDVQASISAERWRGTGSHVEGLGGDLTREMGGGEELSVGTYRSLYKVDLFGLSEREDVRTWYVHWRRRPRLARGEESSRLGLVVGYEYEDGNEQDYHNLKVGWTWRF